jgi:HEAT repeat protein
MPTSLGTFFEADPSVLIQMNDRYRNDDVLKKEIQDIMSLDIYEDMMKGYIEKIVSDKSKDSETAKMEIAKGIGFLAADSPIVDKLDELLIDESAEVRKYAIESVSKIKKREHIPALIQSLQDPPTHGDASAALEKYGAKITGILADYLGDSEEDIELRKSVASILAHIGNQEATDFIMLELAEDKREMDTELIDALDRIRSENSSIEFSGKIVKKKIRQEIKSYYRLFIQFAEEESKGEQEEICRIISHALKKSMMNIFKLLGLIYPHEDIVKAFQNIQTGTKDSVAYAVELLDNTLDKEIKEAILPLVEDLSQEDRAKACLALQNDFPEF